MHLKSNINKMYLLKAVKWFMIIMPIIVLFFEEHGLSLTQIMILQATYSFTVALFESVLFHMCFVSFPCMF